MRYNITAVNNNKDLRVSILDDSVEVDAGEFRTAGAAYDFVRAHGIEPRSRLTLDPATGGRLQLRLAGSRRYD